MTMWAKWLTNVACDFSLLMALFSKSPCNLLDSRDLDKNRNLEKWLFLCPTLLWIEKACLPVHMVLGSGEHARIKTETKPRFGQENDPIAELTEFEWFLMSTGKEFDKNIMLLTQTSQSNYDVLELRDMADHDQSMVFDEFKERLVHSPEGWYETTLPWKANHAELPSIKEGSLKRLKKRSRKTSTWGTDGSIRRDNSRAANRRRYRKGTSCFTVTERVLHPSQERDSHVRWCGSSMTPQPERHPIHRHRMTVCT